MTRFGQTGPLFVLPFVVVISLNGCASPPLITPQQAQDRIYDHLSRAEAFQFTRRGKLARAEREKAGEYRRLIAEGKTSTPEQALAKAAWHAQRADAYQARGYTRFVKAELDAAARYENFAVASGCLTSDAMSNKVKEHRQQATEYDRRGLRRFAKHHRERAATIDRRAKAISVDACASARGEVLPPSP